ncbi:MAG: signal recognition particle-docking protein FtsY [Polyangiaceae bacterium]|jgi:fused signal recognition particle receptor|nr:signal recognition particle-docking protein FtsY [Polyangiaceae bacterium]
MTYLLITVVAIALAFAVYWFALRGRGDAPALGEGKRPEALPPAASDKPTLQQKLDQRRGQMKGELPAPAVEAPPPSSGKPSAAGTPATAKPGEAAEAPLSSKPAPVSEGGAVEVPAPAVTLEAPVLEAAPPPLSLRAPKTAAASRDAVRDLRKGLSRSREGFFGRLVALVSGRASIDPALVDELEEVLVSADVGVKGTTKILERLREVVGREGASDPGQVWEALRAEATRMLERGSGGLTSSARPTVVMLVGVNGAGKTTTIGKLATKLKGEGKKVVLAAGDTFRAAAVQQLEAWGKRVGCEVVRGKDGADPASVAFEAVQKGKAEGADLVLIDTAGRLQTKAPLMEELRKVARTLGKAADGAPHEVWLVLDATTGQNALSQAKQFGETLPLTGLVLTKLDGTAKGGIVLSICEEMGVPVRYIGLGERADDLHEFVPSEFVEALFGDAGRAQDAA